MAQSEADILAMSPHRVMILAGDACRADNAPLMEHTIAALEAHANPHYTVQDLLDKNLRRAAAQGRLNVLRYVLERGADVSKVGPFTLLATEDMAKPSQAAIEILIAHGWDINNQRPGHDGYPFLWHIVEYHDLVEWCLDHGALVDVPEDPPRRGGRPRPTILNRAAGFGDVDTFEMLRARNAPLDARTLHRAVEQAMYNAPKYGDDRDNPHFARRMRMVRHLVDNVKLDVNTVAHAGGSLCSTPLCFPACRPSGQDFRELVFSLLDRGADPQLGGFIDQGPGRPPYEWWSPVHFATICGGSFMSILEEWQVSRKDKSRAA